MGNRNRLFALCIILCCVSLMLFTGCAKPPTQEVESAEKAIADAKKAEVDLYVQDIFAKAENSLKQAKELITQKKYKEAKAAAEEAVKFSVEALTQLAPNKLKMKEETAQKISAAETLIKEIKDPALIFACNAAIEAHKRYKAGEEFTWIDLLPVKLAAAIYCSLAYMNGVEFKKD